MDQKTWKKQPQYSIRFDPETRKMVEDLRAKTGLGTGGILKLAIRVLHKEQTWTRSK